MKIKSEITRKDLAVFSIYLFLRLKSTWLLLAIFVVLIAIILTIIKQPNDFVDCFALAVCSICGGFAGLIVGFIINLVAMLLTIGRKSGVLGLHQYELTEEGLRESTKVNESLQYWDRY